MLAGLPSAVRLSVPEDVAALLATSGRALGAENVTVYLVDGEQYHLMPLPGTHRERREPLSIDATLAGRCFRQLTLTEAHGGREVWVPLLDGLERLGVLQFEYGAPEAGIAEKLLHDFAAVVAEILLVKGAYGDLFTLVRRRQPMSLAGEI